MEFLGDKRRQGSNQLKSIGAHQIGRVMIRRHQNCTETWVYASLIWEFAVPKFWFPRLKLVEDSNHLILLIRRFEVRNVLEQIIGPLLWICKKCLLLLFLEIQRSMTMMMMMKKELIQFLGN